MTAPITQADREALAAYYKARQTGAWSQQVAPHSTLLLEAFAAHRIAAERETAGRIVAHLNKLRDEASELGQHQAGFWTVQIRHAIERGDWRND